MCETNETVCRVIFRRDCYTRRSPIYLYICIYSLYRIVGSVWEWVCEKLCTNARTSFARTHTHTHEREQALATRDTVLAMFSIPFLRYADLLRDCFPSARKLVAAHTLD